MIANLANSGPLLEKIQSLVLVSLWTQNHHQWISAQFHISLFRHLVECVIHPQGIQQPLFSTAICLNPVYRISMLCKTHHSLQNLRNARQCFITAHLNKKQKKVALQSPCSREVYWSSRNREMERCLMCCPWLTCSYVVQISSLFLCGHG